MKHSRPPQQQQPQCIPSAAGPRFNPASLLLPASIRMLGLFKSLRTTGGARLCRYAMPAAASAAMLSRRAHGRAAAGSGAARAWRSTSISEPREQNSLTMQGGVVHTPCGVTRAVGRLASGRQLAAAELQGRHTAGRLATQQRKHAS